MKLTWHQLKLSIGIALGVLLLLDAVLVAVLIESSRQAPQTMRAQADSLKSELSLLKADVARGEKIRGSLDEAGKQCDNFYKSTFLDSSSGYSGITEDLDAIAAKAGLVTHTVGFKQKAVSGRGVTEVSITADIEGDYASIVHFINGLERSKNFYLLRGLTLDSGGTGGIKLKLDLSTYFRT
jgi:Tfp pilus assembly protein PilO